MALPLLGAVLPEAWAAGEATTITPQAGGCRVVQETEAGNFYVLETSSDLEGWLAEDGFTGDGQARVYDLPLTAGDPVFVRFVRQAEGVDRGLAALPIQAEEGFLEETAELGRQLQAAGVGDTDELFRRCGSAYQVNWEVRRLRAAGVAVDAGALLGLLREAEWRSTLRPLEAAGLPRAVTDNLVRSRLDLFTVYRQLRLLPTAPVAGGKFRGDQPQAEDPPPERHLVDGYVALKNQLRETDPAGLSWEHFLALRRYVDTLQPAGPGVAAGGTQETNGGTDQPLDQDPPLVREARLALVTPSDLSFVPPAVRREMQARFLNLPLPLTLLGYRLDRSGPVPVPVEIGPLPPFSEDREAGWRDFLVNRPGLAWFTVYGHAQGGQLTVRDPSGRTVVDAAIPAQGRRALLLPVSPDQVNRPWQVWRDPGLTFVLAGLQAPVSISGSAGRPSVLDEPLTSPLGAAVPGAVWWRFTVDPQALPEGAPAVANVTVRQESAAPEQLIGHAVYGPTGGSSTVAPLPHGVAQSFAFPGAAGGCDLLLLPAAPDGEPLLTFGVEGEGLLAARPWPIGVPEADPPVRSADCSIDLAPRPTRPFLLGLIDTVAFATDGETTGNQGEIRLTFNANVAPYFEDAPDFAAVFSSPASYQAWSRWQEHDRRAAALADDPLFQEGLAAIRLDQDFQDECGALFDPFSGLYEWQNDDHLLAVYTLYVKGRLGTTWYRRLDQAAEIYQAWADDVVQINSFQYPYGQKYKIADHRFAGLVPVPGQTGWWVPTYTRLHPVIPVDLPVLAVPKDRLVEETLPLSVDYSARDADQLDRWDLLSAGLRGVVNAGLAVFSQNWAQAVCAGVDLIDHLHQVMDAARDDPIGSAHFQLNRASRAHGFYGLEDDTWTGFHFSGKPRGNRDHAFQNAIGFAQLACQGFSLLSSLGGDLERLSNNLSSAWDILSTGDLSQLPGLGESLLALARDPEQIAHIQEFLDDLAAGRLGDSVAAALALADLSETLTAGTDLYHTFAALRAGLSEMGGVGSLGFNLSHSDAQFHFGDWTERKTSAHARVGIVRSVPARRVEVRLDGVRLFDLKEEPIDRPAEIYVNTRVGVVADQGPISWSEVGLQFTDAQDQLLLNNGAQGYATLPEIPFVAYAKRRFPAQSFGQYLQETPPQMQYLPPAGDDAMLHAVWPDPSQTAAIYVEVGVFEDDGATIDDDMLGVYSRTFLLEESLRDPDSGWVREDDTHYTLAVTDWPVYDAANLETVVEIAPGPDRDAQLVHNAERRSRPSALVSFHLRLELGPWSVWTDSREYDLRPASASTDLSDVNPAVVATGTERVSAILDLRGGKVLAESAAAPDGGRRLLVFPVDPAAPEPAIGVPLAIDPALLGPVAGAVLGDESYLFAQLAREGDFLVVAHTGGLSVFDLRQPLSAGPSAQVDLSARFPSRLAVDADGEHLYLSFRDGDHDLAVYRLQNDGTLSGVASFDEFPHTVAGLVARPGGGVVVHLLAGIKTRAHHYGLLEDTYFIDPADLTGISAEVPQFWESGSSASGEGFPNAHLLLPLVWEDGQLSLRTPLNLGGEIARRDLFPVRRRHQSSMFRQFDRQTILADNGSFALAWDAHGHWQNPSLVNELDRTYRKYWDTRLLGIDTGLCRVAARLGPVHGEAVWQYQMELPDVLSPFNAYQPGGATVFSQSAVVVGRDLRAWGDLAGRFVVVRGLPVAEWVGFGKASANRDLPTGAAGDLLLVDLQYVPPVPPLAPAYAGEAALPLSHTIDDYTFVGGSRLAVVGSHDTSSGGNDLRVVDFEDPSGPSVVREFGGDLVRVWDLLYVDSRQLLFALGQNFDRVDLHDLANPREPVALGSLPNPRWNPRSLAWSEKRQQLFLAAQAGLVIYTAQPDGSFSTYSETLSGAGQLLDIHVHDGLDRALVTTSQPHEILLLDLSHAGDTSLVQGRVTVLGRWTHPVSPYSWNTAVLASAWAADAATAYIALHNDNRYPDLYRFNTGDPSAPTARDTVYSSTSQVPLIGGLGLSHGGRYLACTRDGLDLFDLTAVGDGALTPTVHFADPEGFHPYGEVVFSPDDTHCLTSRVGGPHRLQRLRLHP